MADTRETRHIGIRNLNGTRGVDVEQKLSLEQVYLERDRMLEEATNGIIQEKASIESMKKSAEQEINSMRELWEDEKQTLIQQAYEEGFQIGHEEGRNKAVSQMTSFIQQANETTVMSLENAQQYIASQERVILDLAMQSAEKIIGQVIAEDDNRFLSVVKRAIKETREMKEIKLYVSLEYFKLISDNRAELASIFPPDIPFLIFVNEEFDSTECYIETNHGRLVVSVDEQLSELRERLIEIMESGD